MRSATLTAEQRELLDRLIARQASAASTGRIARYEGDRRAMPLSPAQQRIWFFSRLDPEAVFYNVAGAARLRGRLDRELLHRCLGEIVERHEVLRTTYHQVDGVPVQSADPFTGLDLPLVDLTGLPAGDREARARELCAEEINRPFDLERDLMLRPVLLRLAEDEHLLLMCQHHIATDGWAMNVLIRELGERYAARIQGREPELPELTVQYGDFAAWQRDWLARPEVERQLDYWRDKLADTRLVDIATGLPRSAELTWRGGTIRYELPAEVFGRLTRLAEAERATPFMALYAAQSVVLSRWSGQDDIVIGTAVAGRRRAELEHLTGCFVNELALRMDLSGTPTFRELLRRSREVCLGAYEHQDVPFERIVEVITPERDNRARVPLVRHQMGYDNSPRWSVELPDVSFSIEPLSTDTARFDLEVDLEPAEDGGVRGTVYFSTDVFTEAIVRRMLDSLTTLLTAVAEDPDTPVRSLPVTGEAERDRLRQPAVAAAGDPARTVTGPTGEPVRTVTGLIAARVREQGTGPAVRQGDTALSFADLDARADRLSWHLAELGVTPGQPVAVCLPASPRLLVALLGVLKAGGAAVPLDPRTSVGDLNDILLDCSTAVVITDGAGPDGLDPMVQAVDIGADHAARPAGRPVAEPAPEQDAFVCYLPPSDGLPRGTVHSHAGVAHRLAHAAAHLDGLGAEERARGVLSLSAGFDLSPWDLLWPVAAGVPLVLPAGAEAPAADAEADAAVLLGPPTALDAFLDRAPRQPRPRRVVCANERPWPALIARLRGSAPDCAVDLRSGPAHLALDVVVQPVADAPAPGTLSALGRPLPGPRLRVLDAAGLPLPGSVPGELCVGGVPSPKGVLGRPQEIRRLLVADPLADGEPLLRTGLRARLLPDGTVEPLGADVRIRTHQVEPTDVETVLHGCADVERAVVQLRTEGDGQPELLAHVSLRPQDTGGQDRLRALFEETYSGRSAEDDPVLNVTGWNSPHTGEYLTGAEMREWADTTFRRVLALNPSRVLEIGCRTGALLFRLAPRCAGYTGTDLSGHALGHIRDHQDWLASKADDVTLLERAADDFDGLPEGGFDTVVLNSVTQYFPGTDYLERVLSGALRVLRPGGHVYLGAVRSLPLLDALHLPGRLEALEPENGAAAVRGALGNRAGQEEELLLDPRWFTALAGRLDGLAEVYVLPRYGRHRNELSAYRYDVVLRAGVPAAETRPEAELDWQTDGLTPEALAAHLGAHAPVRLLVRSVPDARVHGRLAALSLLAAGQASTVADVSAALAPRPAGPGGPLDPAALAAAAERAGYVPLVRYGADGPGTVDVLLVRRTGDADGTEVGPALPEGFGDRPADTCQEPGRPANDPLSVTRGRRVVSGLKQRLLDRLPFPAVPAHLLVVAGFPSDRSGAADPGALPGPDLAAAASEAHRAPSTPTETTLAGIWSAALGVDRVGVHDDFFALGGHSLLGSEVMDRVRQEFSVDAPLGLLFETPTIAAVATYVDQQRAKPRIETPAIRRVDRSTLRRRPATAAAGPAPSEENQ
ncbi:condensation domain-containing protein [Streptomyces collinus]|uniref:condensation domain-containing protein n=1 Tax=Streptomyces collinus TaxID=42684 RepID=UPI00342DDBA0